MSAQQTGTLGWQVSADGFSIRDGSLPEARTPQFRRWIQRTARELFGLRDPGEGAQARLGLAVGSAPENVLPAREFALLVERERNLADRGTRRFCLLVLRERERAGLRGLAEGLRGRLRSTDVVGRLDDHSLAVLLCDTELPGARQVATWLAQRARELDVQLDATIYVYPTVAPEREDDGGPRHGGPPGVHGAANGHATNGHATNGHASNGHSSNGLSSNGHPSNGHSSNGHSRNGAESRAAPRGRGEERNGFAQGRLFHSIEDLYPQLALAGARSRLDLDTEPSAPDWPEADLWPELTAPLPGWKRAFDVAASGMALAVLLPLLAVVALAIKLDSPGPVVFRQSRAGRGGRPFSFYKFRSMYVDAERRRAELAARNEQSGPVFKMQLDPRVTRVGRILRRWSIDELPQLWNILRGDLSLVGPRSPTFDEVEQYERWQRRRLSVTGGVTCIWQVSGRSQVAFRDWMRMDMEYIRRRGAWFDLSLLFRTVPAIVSGRGAY